MKYLENSFFAILLLIVSQSQDYKSWRKYLWQKKELATDFDIVLKNLDIHMITKKSLLRGRKKGPDRESNLILTSFACEFLLVFLDIFDCRSRYSTNNNIRLNFWWKAAGFSLFNLISMVTNLRVDISLRKKISNQKKLSWINLESHELLSLFAIIVHKINKLFPSKNSSNS